MPPRNRYNIADEWAYVARCVLLLHWCAGQAQALRCRFNKPNRFKDIEVVMDLAMNLISGPSPASGSETKDQLERTEI